MKNNIVVVPPFYAGTSFVDIYDSLRSAASKCSVPIHFVGANTPLKNELVGDFLDDEEYVIGQWQLINQLIGMGKIEKVLFLDFFNPGLSLLRYYHEQHEHQCFYGALLHGGTFLNEDLYSWPWLKNVENAWGSIYDSIYAPSLFLKNMVPESYQSKVNVFPWGMDAYFKPLAQVSKDIDVIFPFRLNEDKGIKDFLEIVSEMPTTEFVVTVPQHIKTLEKNRWYRKMILCKNIKFMGEQHGQKHTQTLARAKIILSCAWQETFGYGVMKAVNYGAIPILPHRVCYPEFFDKQFLYKNNDQAIHLINDCLSGKNKSYLSAMGRLKEMIRSFSFQPLLKDFFE